MSWCHMTSSDFKKNMAAKWSEPAVDRLLEEIRRNECLFNKRSSDFKNENYKAGVWKEIAANCGKEVKAVQDKWKGLKDTYTRRKKARNTPTGAAAMEDGTFIEMWRYFHTMDEMLGHTQPSNNESVSNISEPQIEVAQSSTDSTSPEDRDTPSPGVSAPKERKRKNSEHSSDCRAAFAIQSFFEEKRKQLVNDSEKNEEVDGFLKFLRGKLLKLNVDDRSDAIFLIHNTINNFCKERK